MYAVPDDQLHWAPAELACAVNPPPPPVTAFERPVLGGELSGGAYAPYGPASAGVAPPAPDRAPAPQRPATAPQGRRITLLRFVPAFPLQMGHHGDIERVQARSTAVQAPVELRGSTFRAAPDNADPTWIEVGS